MGFVRMGVRKVRMLDYHNLYGRSRLCAHQNKGHILNTIAFVNPNFSSLGPSFG